MTIYLLFVVLLQSVTDIIPPPPQWLATTESTLQTWWYTVFFTVSLGAVSPKCVVPYYALASDAVDCTSVPVGTSVQSEDMTLSRGNVHIRRYQSRHLPVSISTRSWGSVRTVWASWAIHVVHLESSTPARDGLDCAITCHRETSPHCVEEADQSHRGTWIQ